jgi:hypothetical protein
MRIAERKVKMSISAVPGYSNGYSYCSPPASSEAQEISELEEQEKKLQEELKKLQKSSAGSNSQQTRQKENQQRDQPSSAAGTEDSQALESRKGTKSSLLDENVKRFYFPSGLSSLILTRKAIPCAHAKGPDSLSRDRVLFYAMKENLKSHGLALYFCP